MVLSERVLTHIAKAVDKLVADSAPEVLGWITVLVVDNATQPNVHPIEMLSSLPHEDMHVVLMTVAAMIEHARLEYKVDMNETQH